MGSDRAAEGMKNGIYNFNPRSHVGSDMVHVIKEENAVYFNPRSHVGSDSRTMINAWWSYNFNPRSHVGSDSGGVGCPQVPGKFQSTLPRGERHDGL